MIRGVVVALSLAAGLGVAAAQTEPVQQDATTQAPADATSAKPKLTGKQAVPKQAAAKSWPKQAAAPAASGHCVGVLSRLGVTFTLSKIGLVPLLNEERRIPIEEWHVDDLVAARVSAFLGKRAVIRRVPWSRAAYGPLERWRQSSPLFRDNEATMGDVARTLAVGMHCTRYVTVTRHGEPHGGTMLRGIGIVAQVGRTPTIYANAQVRVYDGGSFALLIRKNVSTEPPTVMSVLMDDIPGPHRLVDKALWSWPEPVAPNVKLRDAVRDLVARSLDATLPELKLTE